VQAEAVEAVYEQHGSLALHIARCGWRHWPGAGKLQFGVHGRGQFIETLQIATGLLVVPMRPEGQRSRSSTS